MVLNCWISRNVIVFGVIKRLMVRMSFVVESVVIIVRDKVVSRL